jgi:hypothetical protein
LFQENQGRVWRSKYEEDKNESTFRWGSCSIGENVSTWPHPARKLGNAMSPGNHMSNYNSDTIEERKNGIDEKSAFYATFICVLSPSSLSQYHMCTKNLRAHTKNRPFSYAPHFRVHFTTSFGSSFLTMITFYPRTSMRNVGHM